MPPMMVNLDHESPEIVRHLAAYIPVTLVRRLLTEGLPTPGEPHPLTAATLFADMSGFTPMSEELASDGTRGAEEVTRVLLLTFTEMIDIIHQMGGAVSHFHGDAMAVYFPDEDGTAAKRALTCAQLMQYLMLERFTQIITSRPIGKDPTFFLTMKIGVGYGRCQELVIGSPDSSMEFVVTGAAVDEAAEAEKRSAAGLVVASRAVLIEAGVLVDTDFQLLTEDVLISTAVPILDWSQYDEAALAQLHATIAPFLPPMIHRRLTTAASDEFADHRPVTSMFVQFEYANDKDSSSNIETVEMGQQLQAYYQWAADIVARFGSRNARLNRVLTGDKGNQLHIIFGAPIAPDAPDQAIRCAMALQHQKPDYIANQRIGLAAGKVFAGPIGSTRRREYTVVGDMVNLSARLTQVCEPGHIFTDRSTSQRVKRLFDFTELAPRQLKGKKKTVVPFIPVKDKTATAQLHPYFSRWDRPLVGRDEEFALIQTGMDEALQGNGGVVILSGTTGVGKTRLLAAAVKYWLNSGSVGLVGVCQQHMADNPFGPWRNIWRDFFEIQPEWDMTAQIQDVTNRLTAIIPDISDDIALWEDVLGLPFAQSEHLAELTAEVKQVRLFNMMRRCLQTVSEFKPLLIIVEDIHWSDQASLALIDELSQYLSEWSVYMILTHRPLPGLTLKTIQHEWCQTLIVTDLTPIAARQLIEKLLGTADLPASVEQHLGLRDREGRESPVNPLFLEEALNVMIAAGVLQVNGQVTVNEALLDQMQVPDTIHGMLLARLDRLPPTNRDLLQVASVIGRQFSIESLDTITPRVPRQMIDELMTELSAEEITQLVTTDPEWVYLFQHAMTHEVAYESLPYARRQSLHASVADWLVERYESNLKPLYSILAYHYTQAKMHDKGLTYALAAADAARDIFANQEAADLYTLAEQHLKILGEEERWQTAVYIYIERGYVARHLGNYSYALNNAQQALQIVQQKSDLTLASRTYNLMADLKYRMSHFEETQTWAQAIIDLGSLIPSEQRALAYLWAGMSISAQGNDYETALDNLFKAEKLCSVMGNDQLLARILEAIAFVYYSQQQLELALQVMQRSVKLFQHSSTAVVVASSLNNIAIIQLQLGLAEQSLETFDRAIELVRDHSRNFWARFLGNKVEVLSYLGKYKEAKECFDTAIDLYKAMDDASGLMEVYLLRGYEYHNMLAEWPQAKYFFQQAKEIIDIRPDYPEAQVRLWIGLAQIALNEKQYHEANSWLDQAEIVVQAKQIDWWKPMIRYFSACSKIAQGFSEEAISILHEGIHSINSGGCPDYLPLLYLELAQLEVDKDKKQSYLVKCLETADSRARYLDKVKCFEQASKILLTYHNQEIISTAIIYLEKARSIKTSIQFLEATKNL